jgi:hypothetical protein
MKFTVCFEFESFQAVFFCKQKNYIVCQISEKDHILLINLIQTSGFAVGRPYHTPLA